MDEHLRGGGLAGDGASEHEARVGEAELLDELTARALLATGGRAVRRAKHVAAAMPGRVLRVLVAVGDAVTPGGTGIWRMMPVTLLSAFSCRMWAMSAASLASMGSSSSVYLMPISSQDFCWLLT